jgi:hypothetical protein
MAINQSGLDELNRRCRFHAEEHFVVRKNRLKEIWFVAGEEPEDSWERTHGRPQEDRDDDEDD